MPRLIKLSELHTGTLAGMAALPEETQRRIADSKTPEFFEAAGPNPDSPDPRQQGPVVTLG